MDEKLEQGAIYAEKVFNGARVPGLVFVDEESWHTDWQLIPRDQEVQYRIPAEELKEHGHPSTVKVLPRWMEVPPLMDIYLRRHCKARGGVTVAPIKLDSKLINIRMHYDFERLSKPHEVFRVAEEGEKADTIR